MINVLIGLSRQSEKGSIANELMYCIDAAVGFWSDGLPVCLLQHDGAFWSIQVGYSGELYN